jgi:glycyl-radical enzyme activating protein
MDVKKFAVHDGPGVRTTLFLKGCPMKCIWCHNPEGIIAKAEMAYYRHKCIGCGECIGVCPNGAHSFEGGEHRFFRERCTACGACETACLGEAMKRFGRTIDVDEAVRIVLEDRTFYTTSNGGVTVSGGEPLLYADFVMELFGRMREEGIHTAVDTCGCVGWEEFEKVLPVTDIFLYDVKHIDSEKHRELTGRGNERILDNLKKLSDTGTRIEIRMPLVPEHNADDETVGRIGDFLGTLNIERMKVLPYHSLARSKYAALGKTDTMPDVEPPTDDMLRRAVEILRARGVNAVSGRD